MVSLVFGVLAFLATTLIVAGIFGRPDQRTPRCRRCGADARPYAWENPPRCACNADLSRPGAVRTRGRLRRPWLTVVGLALLLGAVALGVPAHRAIAARGSNAAIVPEWVLAFGVDRGWDWAIVEVGDRARHLELTPDSAADLWQIAHRRLLPSATSSERLHDTAVALERVWGRDARAGARVLVQSMGPSALLHGEAPGAEPIPVRRGETQSLSLRFSADKASYRFLRITEVRVGDVALDPELGRTLGRPTRILGGACDVVVSLPRDIPLGEASLTIDLIAVQSPAFLTAMGDPLIDSALPPSEWRLDVITAPHRIEIPVRVFEASAEAPPP